MSINPIVAFNIQNLGRNVQLPNSARNYCIFDYKKIDKILREGENALPYVENALRIAKDEKAVCEGLYILDRMIDKKVKGVKNIYPTLSRFNDTNSPNIQVLLSGIYRKTLIPDAFGPLNKMFLKQTFYPNSPYFDPTEEIGGAILEYLRSKNAQQVYGGN